MIKVFKKLISKDPAIVKPARKKLKLMLSQLNLMQGYVEDMLNFAMIKAQKFHLNFSNFSLWKVTKFIKETFTLKVGAKGIKLNFMMTDRLSMPQDLDYSQANSSYFEQLAIVD